ncbi:PhoX family phosphatase [Plantactinospora sp. BC1]|uniref:PhoX family protein n=1 Tax=Plantactinospora sp. BC1 TaxID=2108470 RepID=UPI000D17053D|nr:PhoX family phosphatase [Plantactinospora sp. BC1]AVT32043.1 PhoX family phosphatase [Plantactinospora sp. BC1]
MSIDHAAQSVPDPDDRRSNPSTSTPFRDLLNARVSRRALVRGGTVVAATGFLAVADSAPLVRTLGVPAAGASGRSLLGFAPVAANADDAVTLPAGYRADVIIPWGTPIRSTGPAWRPDGTNSAAEQAEQVGMQHDGMHFFPRGPGPAGNRRGLLVVNHEYTDRTLLHADGDAVMTREKSDKTLAALGVTVLEIAQRDGAWRPVDSPFNRRINGTTRMTYSGPVSPRHPALRAVGLPRGTLNNCSHGVTPWGTYLACEENFNIYFGTADPAWTPGPEHDRYGISRTGLDYRLHLADPRFDLARNPNEPNRFGWVVEIDPFRPDSTPVKRTALGRFKHEGATVTESRGHLVVYSGDDQDGEYIYKYVSAAPWAAMRARGRSPLDEGTLYVARFDDDRTGRWLPLRFGHGPLTPAQGWTDQADVLLRTRRAADALGATPLDRPEWISVHPENSAVYASLSNGSGWAHAVTPRTPNPYGHIIRWRESGDDNTATTFEWDVFVLGGDPAYDDRVRLDDAGIFGSPDGLWFDPDGRLWIQTDVSNYVLNSPGWGYDRIGNNAMLACDPGTGEIRRFLVGPRGCEITGITVTPDRRTMFVNVQHPGELTPAWGSPTPENPRAVSNWPDFDPAGRPRSATLVIRKEDGGIIGT